MYASLHRVRTLSHSGSDGALAGTASLGPAADGPPSSDGGAGPSLPADPAELPSFVQHLEALQSRQRSPQQPTPEVDVLLAHLLEDKPEWRTRLAVLTRSPALRQKILGVVPTGARAVGSGSLGSTHPWRQSAAERTLTAAGLTASGSPAIPAERVRMDPTILHTECYSLPRAQRFEGINDRGEVDLQILQRRSSPGPGAYSKSMPRGTAFSDGGERVVLGANHTFAFRRVLGRQINPIDVDATSLPSAPAYSFGGSRRTLSETSVGHNQQTGGPAKSDLGALSPGPVYEHLASMRPKGGGGAASVPRQMIRRTRSRPAVGGPPRMRCVPVPPEEDSQEAEPLDREEH